MKKLSIPLQLILVALAAILLNAIIYYSINCSGGVLQNEDVFGAPYFYITEEVIRQETILDSLPADRGEAETFLREKIQTLQEEYEKETAHLTSEEAYLALQNMQEAKRPYEAVLSQMIHVKNYPEYVKGIADNAGELLEFPMYQEKGWLHNNIIQTQKDFYGLEQIVLTPVNEAGFMSLLNYRITDIFALLLTMGATWILAPSKELSVRKRYLGPIFIWFVSLCSMYLLNMGMTAGSIGLPEFQVALQSLQPFQSCPYLISCGTLLLLCLTFKLVGFGIILCVGLFCFSCHKKWPVAVLGGLVGAEAWLAFMNRDTGAVSEFLREINLFSAFKAERFFLRYLNLNIVGQAVAPWPIFVTFIVLLSVMALFATTRRVSAYTREIRGRVERAYYDELDQRYEETRKIRHDITNHLLALRLLVEKGDLASAKAYIGEISEELDQTIMPVRTGSKVLDALIWQKICQARKGNITIQTEIHCSVNGRNISDYDLCGIFGNILDNAIEAVEGMESPIINLFIGNQLDMLYISCKNAYEGERSKRGENYITTKDSPESHGLGIPRVREIARLYDGEVNISTEDGCFLIEILLNNK